MEFDFFTKLISLNSKKLHTVSHHSCVNCQTEFTGRFCPECGLRLGVLPNTLNFLFDSVLKVLDFERGMPITFLHLFTKPEAVTGQFLVGNTYKYSNPIQYLFIAVTVTLFFFFDKENWLIYTRSAYLVLFILLSNLIFSMRHTNFYGHLMIAFYQVGQITFLFLISALVSPYLKQIIAYPELLILLKYVIFIAYVVWSSAKIFDLSGYKVLSLALVTLFFVNMGLYIWVEFIVSNKFFGS